MEIERIGIHNSNKAGIFEGSFLEDTFFGKTARGGQIDPAHSTLPPHVKIAQVLNQNEKGSNLIFIAD